MNRPLNFLHVSTFYPPYSFGGDAIQIHRLAGALAKAGHHVDVVHCVDSYHLLHPGEPPVAFQEQPGVFRHELHSGFGSLSPLLSQQSGRPWLKQKKIAELLQARAYDVIHFHNISLFGPAVLSIGVGTSEAIRLYTTHEHWLVCPTHVLWKFNSRPCEKPECLRCTLQAKRPPQFWRYTGLRDRMVKHADQFIAPSRFVAGMHAERGFAGPFECLPNFIERDDDAWQNPRPRPQEAPYFLFVGRLEEIKGLQTLIRVWDRAPKCDLLVAGTGSYETELRAMAADNPRIRFLGPLAQRDLGALYHHALACIIPSITYETFGMTSVEAFARKTPAIARDLGGLAEVIHESGGGLLYTSDEQLLDALKRIAESPSFRAELAEKGYRGFIRWWCTDAHLSRYFGIIDRVAQRKLGSVPWAQTMPASI